MENSCVCSSIHLAYYYYFGVPLCDFCICVSVTQMDTHVCPRRILVSNLPKKDSEFLLDKLEIHFSKRRNGGGEVEERDMLHDSGNVVIAFIHTDGEFSSVEMSFYFMVTKLNQT